MKGKGMKGKGRQTANTRRLEMAIWYELLVHAWPIIILKVSFPTW